MHQWHTYHNFEQASQAAANKIALLIRQCLQENNVCHVILPGGNTPVQTFQCLSKKELAWEKVHWYPGDERCCPVGDSDRNDVMLEKTLWSLLPGNCIDQNTVHVIPAELGAEKAAKIFSETIKNISRFDIALLGMGEDGHTASLFPDNPVLADKRPVVPVFDSPKPPSERVSFGVEVLRACHHKIVLASGKSKAAIIARIKTGERLPVNCLGDIDWYVDQAAIVR